MAEIEALWSIEFVSNLNMEGRGIVVFETDRIFGGDTSFYYVGDYKITNGKIEGTIKITNYGGTSSSVVGQGKEFCLKLSGKIQEPVMELKGYRDDAPQIEILIRCTKRAALP